MRGLAIATIRLRRAKWRTQAVPSLWPASRIIVHALVFAEAIRRPLIGASQSQLDPAGAWFDDVMSFHRLAAV
jgi:hypothetical protein